MVGSGIANSSVAAGKLAADDVTTDSEGTANPELLVAPVPMYGMESGMSGSLEGALVLIVICGIAKVEVALGNSVPEVCPAVGITPGLDPDGQARAVSPSFVPVIAEGGDNVGIVKNVSV